MILFPLTAVVSQPFVPIVSTTIDFEVDNTVKLREIKTYHLQIIGTTATTDQENLQMNNYVPYNEDSFDLSIKSLPKTLTTKKVKIISVMKFQPKVYL